MSFFVPDSLLSKAGDLMAAEYRTSSDELPPPLCYQLSIDLGGCDSVLIADQGRVADWADRMRDRLHLDVPPPVEATGVFGSDDNPGVSVRFTFRRPGWRGVAQPVKAEATVRVDPDAHGVHIDMWTRDILPDGRAIAAFSADYFAARCGTGTCRARRVPGLTTGFTWMEEL